MVKYIVSEKNILVQIHQISDHKNMELYYFLLPIITTHVHNAKIDFWIYLKSPNMYTLNYNSTENIINQCHVIINYNYL